MKINADLLKNFINKISIGGEISNLLLEVSNDGIISKSRTSENARITIGQLKTTAITNLTPGIKIPIKDTKFLMDVLKLFDKNDVNLVVTDNALKIYNNEQEALIFLAQEEFIENKVPSNFKFKVDFDGGVDIPDSVNQNIYKQLSMLKPDDMTIEFKNKQLIITSKAKNQDIISIRTPVDYKDVKTKVQPEFLQKGLGILEGSINYSIMDDSQLLRLKENNDKICVSLIIAPLMEEG